MSKNTILKGTLILTAAGLLTRILGFFYRIYLSNTLGAQNVGIYQLVFPIYGICFTLYASGIQTSISKLVAAELWNPSTRNQKSASILKMGLALSIIIACVLSFIVYHFSDFIAEHFILEPSCASSLRILSYIFPFCGMTACINGYYYGLKKTSVPAVTQLLEQLVRVISVYLLAIYFGKNNMKITCELAILGLVFGEIASNLYNLSSLFFQRRKAKKEDLQYQGKPYIRVKSEEKHTFAPLLKMAVPLTGNRLLISILNSIEAILIPTMLKKSGLLPEDALSIYGILTGMSIPFIMFPSTITNSLAVLLLPTVSEAQAANNNSLITHTTEITIKYSLLIGLFSTAIFIMLGDSLGNFFFHNKLAGSFLVTLSWLCPFLYLTTTLGSIINGLGKAHYTLFNTVIGLFIRILFIVYLVPIQGIKGYLIGLLVSQLTISLLDFLAIRHTISLSFESKDWILKPSLILVFIGFLIKKTYDYFITIQEFNQFFLMIAVCFLLLICYIIMLLMTKAISLSDFK